MAASKNAVFLIGNVGQDPEIRTTQDGKKIVSLSLATSEKWKDRASGERKEATTWHSVVIFNPHFADIVAQHVKKGAKIGVEGKLQTRSWTDQGNVTRYRTEIVLGQYTGNIMLLRDTGASFNEASLLGCLGADPEIRTTGNGRKLATFRIATSDVWTDRASGQKKERTEWHTVTLFNDHLAGLADQYLKKGSAVLIKGKITVEKWTDNDGNDRYSTKVVVGAYDGSMTLLGDSKGAAAPSEEDYGSTRGWGGTTADGYDLSDEIPF